MATVVGSGKERLACPYCRSYEVDRMYLASGGVDACWCRSCGARWDEDITTGDFRGRAPRSSAADPRP